jgi:hypothetical protein
MWFGRVVPLLQFPLIDRRTDRSQQSFREVEEERSMPLLNELCLGMSIEDGTALYVTYGINNDTVRWGDDLAGWFAIAPFPLALFNTDQLTHLGVNLINEPGKFQGGITEPIKVNKGIFLYMEVLGTGDVGGLILHPKGASKKMRNDIEEGIREDSGKDSEDKLRSIELRLWGNKKSISNNSAPAKECPNNTPSTATGWYSILQRTLKGESKGEESPPGRWTQDLFKDTKIKWVEDRRILVRDRHIVIPYGEFWYKLDKQLEQMGKEKAKSLVRPNYCLLARDMELPILLALIPNRPLFRIDLDVSVREGPDQDDLVGVGIINNVVTRLSDDKINIWHVHNKFRSLTFHPVEKHADPDDNTPYRIRGADSHISIVASVPKDRSHDSPEAIAAYLQNLREDLMQLRLETPTLQEIQRKIDELPKTLFDKYKEIRSKEIEDIKKGINDGKELSELLKPLPDDDTRTRRLLHRLINSNFNRMKKEVLDPSFVQNVDIHGPPLFRCFLSHSFDPAYDERDHIIRLKAILEAEVFEVVEGEFSFGQSTEALSRGRIRPCNIFVSFLWPRESFRKTDGTYSPPEWIIHEESFAIGQNIPVYRVIEESVDNPRYEHDRPAFKFKKNDLDSWSNLERTFRLEIRELALRILLGAPSTTTDRMRYRAGPLK